MRTASLRRKTLLLLLLAACLALPWPAGAAPLKGTKTVASAPLALWNGAWSFLQSLWAEAGCWIDPNGRCVTQPKPTTDTGCGIDPGGRCASAVTPGARPTPSLDEGCGLDPGGRCR